MRSEKREEKKAIWDEEFLFMRSAGDQETWNRLEDRVNEEEL